MTVWNDIVSKLKEEFREGHFAAGVIALIKRIGDILCAEFPTRAGADNDDEIEREIVIK